MRRKTTDRRPQTADSGLRTPDSGLLSLRQGSALKALWDRLTEPERAEAFAVAANGSWSDWQTWLTSHGCTPSTTRVITETRNKLRQAEDARRRAAEAGQVVKALAAEGNAAISVKAATALGDIVLASIDPTDAASRKLLSEAAATLATIYRAEIAADANALRKSALALDRDRFQFDAAKACLAHLPALRKIAADKSIDDSARIQQVRQALFGEVPA